MRIWAVLIVLAYLMSSAGKGDTKNDTDTIIRPDPTREAAYFDWKKNRYVYKDEIDSTTYRGPSYHKPRFSERRNDIIDALEYYDENGW